jgi:transposase-like protein
VKIRGQWVYLYRAVDHDGNTEDFRLSRTRDVAAAKAFFRKALKTRGRGALSIALDGYAASHRAVREMPPEEMIWKDTKRTMLGFKSFKRAAVTIAGVELLQRIRKGQFDLGRLGVRASPLPSSGPRCYQLEIQKLKQKSLVPAANLHQSRPHLVCSVRVLRPIHA